jgi:ABC-type lipoprotein export system ATPase subunit
LGERDLAAWRATHVGFIFQFYNLMPVLNAFDNVELPLLLTALSRRDRRERVPRHSHSWASRIEWTITRTNCPVASNSAWRLRVR